MRWILLICVSFCCCERSYKVKDLIRGEWYYDESSDEYIEITRNTYTVQNDSPIPEEYKIIGDTIIQTSFEGQVQSELKIVKISSDSLILSLDNEMLRLFKK